MPRTDLLRNSRDGDQFHYTWAARQSLRLLDERSDLLALYVEAVDPSETEASERVPMPTAVIDATAASESDTYQPLISSSADSATGDEVIDLAEYWGSTNIDETKRVVYRQFKHSTQHPDDPWTLSYLTKTLVGFARKYRSLRDEHRATLERVEFEFVCNRPAAESVLKTLGQLRAGTDSAEVRAIHTRLEAILTPAEIRELCIRLTVDERAPSLLKLRHLLAMQVADLLPGAPGEQALLLREMISTRATNIAGANPAVHRDDVLAALKTSGDQLLPAPNLIVTPANPITRRQFSDIASVIQELEGVPLVVHGPGGVGKSVLAAALQDRAPTGSLTITFDCYANGSYRRLSSQRHLPKQGLVQLVNELAAHALCDPVVPSATADDRDYARMFLRRVETAAEALAVRTPGALLTFVIDAADNAAMIAEDNGERSFVSGLVRESLPSNVRLVLTCRTERMDLLGLPPVYRGILLGGFTPDETRANLEAAFSSVSTADVAEFQVRTSRNPRVQATVLAATSSIAEALAWLGPNPASPEEALDALIERQVDEIRDGLHRSAFEIDQICTGLAALRPMIPVRVLAKLAGVHESVVHSFVADLGRPLVVDGGTVQFRDEPTETWFRTRYRPTGATLDAFLARLIPMADDDAYVAASVPSLLFEADRFDDLVELALSEAGLPDSALPGDQRNEVQRREIAQQRAHFALVAALRRDDDYAAAQLALRLGALNAGRTRRLGLIRDNTDLAARFLDSHVLEHLVAVRSVSSDWPNSNLPYEAAMLAGADGQTDQARNRLRSASTWISAWTRQASRSKTDSGVVDQDILQLAWGLFLTDGAKACVRFLRSWHPKEVAFDVGILVLRRLADAGRFEDIAEFARHARGRHLKFAVAQICAERALPMEASIVRHLLRPILKRSKSVMPSRRDDDRTSTSGEYVHGGVTAVNWIVTQCLANDLIDLSVAQEMLRPYVPENLGHHNGDWHDRDIWERILAQALKARAEGRALTAEEIEGPRIAEARTRRNYEYSQDLRAYEANVEPLVEWANLWIRMQIHPTETDIQEFRTAADQFLRQKSQAGRDEDIGQVQLNIISLLILRIAAAYPDLVGVSDVRSFWLENRSRLWRGTRIRLVREAATASHFHQFALEMAETIHRRMVEAREDAKERADDLVRLSRAVLPLSVIDAAAYFQAALEITDAVGDDAWARWEVLLKLAEAAADTTDQPGRAYRLGQIAEGLEPYIGDGLNHVDTLAAAVGLSLAEGVALGSRWRDRRFVPIGRLVAALATSSDSPLSDQPLALVALLPLNDSYIDDHRLAQELILPPETAAESICALLRLRRANPFSPENLDTILAGAGLTRKGIADFDPSLRLAPEGESTAGDRTYGRDESKATPLQFEDIDFSTAQGWAKGLERAGGMDRGQVFAHLINTRQLSPEVLSAFADSPTVDRWDLDALVEALDGQDLSLAAKRSADSAFVRVLARVAAEYLLVSWRSVDIATMRSITRQETDYEHAMSRGLVAVPAFEADQAFALAGNLASRVDKDHAQQLFDSAAGLFAEVAPLDSSDGHWPSGLAGGLDTSQALAAMIWTALGDPAIATRWRAAHVVHMVLVLRQSGVADELIALATGRHGANAFRDSRLEFYGRHALQWLLFGISRASADDQARESVQAFVPLLRRVLAEEPHAINVPLVRDILLRLQQAGLLSLDDSEARTIAAIGRPIGVLKHDWHAPERVASSLDDLPPVDVIHAISEGGDEEGDEDHHDDAFHFFYDFGPYWCKWVSDAFGLTERSVERLVEEVLIARWGVTSRGRSEDDPRHVHDLYPRNNYPYKSDWPKEEDLDFYLSVQGLYEVAGILLECMPVQNRYDDDEATGDNDYTRFLRVHMPSRPDGRWLADRRDAPPNHARLGDYHPTSGNSEAADFEWTFEITAEMFTQELLRSDNRVAVWVARDVAGYTRRETVRVHSALVSPETAPALLRALQTAPDKHAFRIPDTSDEDYSSALEGFELTGWIDPSEERSGQDRQDPLAGDITFPPHRPAKSFAELKPDPDLREWRDQSGNVVLDSLVWSDWEEGARARGTSGEELLADRCWLGEQLKRLNRWLLVEVEYHRTCDRDRSRPRSTQPEDDDERLRYLQPYTKYFLLDAEGTVHEL